MMLTNSSDLAGLTLTYKMLARTYEIMLVMVSS